MNSRNDVLKSIKATKKRLEEAEMIQGYLEKSVAPKSQIVAIKRIVKHLDNLHATEKLAFALSDLQTKGNVRPEDEEENAFNL